MCLIVFVLCVPVSGVVLRFVSVLSYVMVEKVERLLRGQWSAFNIYGASRYSSRGGVLSSRLAFLLVPRLVGASRFSSRPWASCLAVLRWRLVSFRLCVLSRRVSRWGISCRGRLVSFLPLRASFRLFVSFLSRFCLALVAIVAGWRFGWGVMAVMVFSCRHMVLGRGGLSPRIPIVSVVRGRGG